MRQWPDMLDQWLRRRTQTTEAPPSRLFAILARVDEAIRVPSPLPVVLKLLDASKWELFYCLRPQCPSSTVAKALTLKILNLCLAKYHFTARNPTVVSRPFGLNIDPANACNLACPGCVHSHHVKELKLFSWDKTSLSENRLASLFDCYGPYAIHVVFCNYGEPLVNPDTPKFIRMAKTYLMQAMISSNMGIGRFDADAYVESGMDYAIVSIDGATQPVYEIFRRTGRLDGVLGNVRKLVEAKRRLGRRTPVIAWRFLTFRHNVHEVPLAIETAREIGVDEFITHTPYDVSWDDPAIQPAAMEPMHVFFNSQAEQCVLENWNPFPDALATAAIEREFALNWIDRMPAAGWDDTPKPGDACQWLYKSITVDGGGRVFPCCAPPRPDIDLVFGQFDGPADAGLYNSDKYRLSRLVFSDPNAYQSRLAASGLLREPHCAHCEWDKDHVNTDGRQVRQYFKAAGGKLFDEPSMGILAGW